MDLNKITQDALALSVRERGILAAQLLASMESSESTDVQASIAHDASWLDLAEQRLRELDEGRVQPIGEEEVERRIRARIQ